MSVSARVDCVLEGAMVKVPSSEARPTFWLGVSYSLSQS